MDGHVSCLPSRVPLTILKQQQHALLPAVKFCRWKIAFHHIFFLSLITNLFRFYRYEELIDKVDRDNKPFDRQQAQDEVDKLLLNRETLDKYIQFEKDKPRNAQEMLDAERATLQEPGTILTYVFWVLLFPVISYLQKTDFFDGLLGGGGGNDSLIQ